MNNLCPICWDKFDKTNYYYLPCNHIICHKCYIIFIKQYTNCCLCRSPFEPDMVKEIRFIPERHGKNWTNIEKFSLIDLYLDSQSINRIAKKLQRTEEAIISKLEKYLQLVYEIFVLLVHRMFFSLIYLHLKIYFAYIF